MVRALAFALLLGLAAASPAAELSAADAKAIRAVTIMPVIGRTQ